MTPLLLVFLLIAFKQYNALTIIKSATITPNTPNLQHNGATVTEVHAITRTATKWTLHDPMTQQGFHLQLTLNASWGFHPTENTTLKIEVNADGYTSSINQLMLAFSQTDSNIKYFTTRINIDSSYDHRIYPPCDWTTPYEQIYLAANVTSLVNEYNGGNAQFYKAAGGYIQYTYNPQLAAAQRMVNSPLTFILLNNPNDKYMLFTYTNPNVIDRSCGFLQMDPNKGMDIYFAANGIYSSVDISSFIITHLYETTEAPTSDPTRIPTMNPTIIPTINPTLQPTAVPTKDPSTNPTTEPTKVPTNNPTVNPSTKPTKLPTNTPIVNPTTSPTKLSSVTPSLRPLYSAINNSSNSPTEAMNDYISTTLLPNVNVANSGDTANNIQYIMITGSVCGVLILIIMVLIIIIITKKRKINATKKQKTLSSLQHDTNSQHIITEMVVMAKSNDIDVNDDDDDLYDEVQSIDTIGVTTTRSAGNSLLNAKDVSGDEEEDDNVEVEAMYNVAKSTTTARCVSDEGESDEESEVTSKGITDIVKPNVEHIEDNINSVDEVKEWLNEIVELPQYYDLFVSNGLNSLKLIKTLNDNQALIDLGIELKGHRIIMMKYIKQLTIEGDSV